MSTTLYFLSLSAESEALFIAGQKADDAYWRLIGDSGEHIESVPRDVLTAADRAQDKAAGAWYDARVALGAAEQLPILEASHRDTEECELLALFEAAEGYIITVSDSNIQELTDAWEDSNSKRTFSMGRGKGTVYSWLLAHRGEKITVSS